MTSQNLATSAVALPWSLNETAGSTLSIAKGVLKAATTDDVQPIAIMAAEAFGATLAMCQETQMKAEIAAKQSHTRFVRFLQSSIGYSKDDCAYHLASSSAGVRFLGLSATLLCMNNHFLAAQSLELMVRSSAGAGQLLPTARQLKELLVALEYKLNRVGFSDSIMGWGTYLANHPLVGDEFRQFIGQADFHPSTECLEKLVEGLRSLDRVGDASHIRIKAGRECLWVIAFVKWCIGEPPMILLEDGSVLADQKEARVTLVIVIPSTPRPRSNPVTNNAFNIEVFNHLGHPSILWSDTGEKRMAWRGMVTVERIYQRILDQFHSTTNSGIPCQAVRCIVDTVTSRVRGLPKTLSGTGEFPLADSGPSYRRITLYPDDASLNASFAKFAQCSKVDVDASVVSELKRGQRFGDIPLIAGYLRQLNCRCGECDVLEIRTFCLKKAFEMSVVRIAAIVIIFALFDWTEQILVSGPETKQYFKIGSIIHNSDNALSQRENPTNRLLEDALALVGHQSGPRSESWFATGHRGQVAYFKAFDTMELPDDGVFCLGGGPGKLLHEGISYSSVKAAGWGGPLENVEVLDIPVDRVLNCFAEKRLNWHISKLEEELWLGWNITGMRRTYAPTCLPNLFQSSRLIIDCPHPETGVLSGADHDCVFVEPSTFDLPRIKESKRIYVVPVAGDNALRLFCFIALGEKKIVRGNRVCLACCLDVCRRTETRIIIL